jgi:hypothetical protein
MFGEEAVCPDGLFVPAVFRESNYYLNSLMLSKKEPYVVHGLSVFLFFQELKKIRPPARKKKWRETLGQTP